MPAPRAATERPLKVVRVIPVLDFGGVESIFVQWARLVDRERYEPRVCTFWKEGKAAEDVRAAGVPVDCLSEDPSVRNPRATLALLRYLRALRPDVVHCAISEANFHGAWAGRAARVPRLLLEETGIPNRTLAGRLAYAVAFQMADTLICVSEATERYVQQEELAPRGRTCVIHNSMDAKYLAPVERSARSRDELRVLAVGRLEPVKNFDGLLRAFRGVVDAFPGARLSIAGEGPARPELERLRHELGLEPYVDLLGFRTDVRALHLAADLFVLPSHFEGLSVALVEAMASSLPVLVSDRGGNPEVVRGLGDGLLLDPEDPAAWTEAIVRFARLPPEAGLEAGARARGTAVERFSPSRYMSKIDEVYQAAPRRRTR